MSSIRSIMMSIVAVTALGIGSTSAFAQAASAVPDNGGSGVYSGLGNQAPDPTSCPPRQLGAVYRLTVTRGTVKLRIPPCAIAVIDGQGFSEGPTGNYEVVSHEAIVTFDGGIVVSFGASDSGQSTAAGTLRYDAKDAAYDDPDGMKESTVTFDGTGYFTVGDEGLDSVSDLNGTWITVDGSAKYTIANFERLTAYGNVTVDAANVLRAHVFDQASATVHGCWEAGAADQATVAGDCVHLNVIAGIMDGQAPKVSRIPAVSSPPSSLPNKP